MDIINLDIQKALDKVPPEKPLAKLKSLGFGGNLLAWMRGWLINRVQRVVINGEVSDWMQVTGRVRLLKFAFCGLTRHKTMQTRCGGRELELVCLFHEEP